ncbi:MAG: hypothetical protein DWQ31_14650 [Planctomycetota bacterium]|nr:MAG: hypothetical protein DWQ31_14650 [Planctomycetota bacterium]REJ96091.1 MAG: hypothetical protein DWQ35_05110 [Planctomycetota bacterium]REK21863.1 MAG: hypothetical protein DWQ42_18440 [Planctomycetota bacterium]REK46671.1 MAG: hypothetical protein DWQ46_06125 [Planctomycetota bacterium]
MSYSRWIFVGVLVALIAAAVAYRGLALLAFPMGTGRYGDSPDGNYRAHASNMYEENFWGIPNYYYQFEVHAKNGRLLRSRQIPEPFAAVDFREGEGQIMWAENSRSVSFGTPDNVIWSTPVP